MNNQQRKGINFDLDTKKLKKNYPKEKGDWHNAYNIMRIFFEQEGFEHIQGSGYHSKDPMSQARAMAAIYKMTKVHPWLNDCVRVCTIADIPETTDITHVFAEEARKSKKIHSGCL